MKRKFVGVLVGAVASATVLLSSSAHAESFKNASGSVEGALDSTLTVGFGKRIQAQSCALIGDTNSSCGASANTAQWSAGDNGDLNYNKGDFFSAYLKGTHELLMSIPEEKIKIMLRASWMKDFKANSTRRTDLSSDARDQVVNDVRLLDAWISKQFEIGGQTARVRLGNQVINWGESLYGVGGINATNSLDYQRLMVPGTQIKEAVLPAPMISLASALGNGFNVEGYYQFGWNRNRLPPVGSYFSVADYYDKGREQVSYNGGNYNVTGLDPAAVTGKRNPTITDVLATGNTDFWVPTIDDKTPRKQGQYGLSLHYKPQGADIDFGFYYLNYHDKAPVLNLAGSGTEFQWQFKEDRKLFGVSANFPLGNWAIGTELSYRPKDAVALSGCFASGGPLDANTNGVVLNNCPLWADNKKYQFHLTGQLQLTPGDHKPVLDFLGADAGFLTAELVAIKYPGIGANTRITRSIEGISVDQVPAAGYLVFLDRMNPASPITAGGGTDVSAGYVVDFNWTYDGTVIPGWQLTPGMTFSHSFKGNTPTFTANYLDGAKSANFYLLFNQNPVKWQAGLNVTKYFGGKTDPMRQVYSDRDFVGGFVSYSF